MICDGTKYSASAYPNLYDALKDLDHTCWKEAHWETEFTVPDLRGEFLRGTGTNSHSNQGSGAAVGTHQDGTNMPYIAANGPAYDLIWSKASYKEPSNCDSLSGLGTSGRPWIHGNYDSNTSVYMREWFTSRPTNTSVLYLIKT